MKPVIPQTEFAQRVSATQQAMAEAGLDLLLCFGNEAEPQFVRYYADYWPSFESAGVLIPVHGEPLLIIGPESGAYAAHVSRIEKIRRLLVFRESSEPEYPGAVLDTFDSVIAESMGSKAPQKFGIAGSCLVPQTIFADLERSLQKMGTCLVKADLLVSKLRAHKSPNEIACMREAYRITQRAMKLAVESIHTGMTENQLKGIALAEIFAQGGESEAYPSWILTGSDSNQAISRCRGKTIMSGDLVQIQVGARYAGYASTMGRPVVMGKATKEQAGLIEAGLAAQKAILQTAGPGVNAKAVSDAHFQTLQRLGYADHILYGPCHGTGLMEGEYPWIESNSDYLLEPGMTFCTCVYLGNNQSGIGIRVEDGFAITEQGVESFSDYRRELIEI